MRAAGRPKRIIRKYVDTGDRTAADLFFALGNGMGCQSFGGWSTAAPHGGVPADGAVVTGRAIANICRCSRARPRPAPEARGEVLYALEARRLEDARVPGRHLRGLGPRAGALRQTVEEAPKGESSRKR